MTEPACITKVRLPKKNRNYSSYAVHSTVAGLDDDIPRILEELRRFLTNRLHYTDDEASVYLLALEKGTITSGDVSRRLPKIRTSTAKDILERLYGRSLLQQTPRKPETSGKTAGRGYVSYYRVIPPDQAFSDHFQEYAKFKANIEKIGEHLEIRSESDPHNSDIWLTRQQKIAAAQGAGIIRAAKRSLKIYGHDCSWLNDLEVRDAVVTAPSRGVRVELIATNLTGALLKVVATRGIKPKQTRFVTVPFCLVDGYHLLIPHAGGDYGSEMGLISTTNQSLAGNFLKMFDELYGKNGGRRC